MKPEKESAKGISRKKFLSVCGSVIAGGSLVGITGLLLKDRVVESSTSKISRMKAANPEQGFDSPYKLVSSFSASKEIKSFEVYEDKLIASGSDKVFIYDKTGAVLKSFATEGEVRDLVVDNGKIYILYPTVIGVYDFEGNRVAGWESCSPESDYCSFTVTGGFVFVTDAANKNICKYTATGGFVKIIDSPNGFVIPSYTFGITHIEDKIYCSNPGRHQVESYTMEGDYITAFGQPGGASGMFCGCCNPVYLSYTSTGEIITSEKGNPRISCYGQDGQFRSLLLDSKALGGGNVAYDVKVQKDKIYIAGNGMVSTFQYDRLLAAKTSCSACKVDCPLREGVLI